MILHRRTKEHAKLVGKIIFANFLSHSLGKYKSIIENVESSPLFQKLLVSQNPSQKDEFPINPAPFYRVLNPAERKDKKKLHPATSSGVLKRGWINIKYLSKVRAVTYEAQSSRVIAEIQSLNRAFYIKYTYEGFNKEYIINRRKLNELKAEFSSTDLENDEIDKLLHKLRRISSRNKITHAMLKGVIKHQECYFQSGNPLDLIPLGQVQLSNWLNGYEKNCSCPDLSGNYIDNSVISRIISGKSIITSFGDEIPLESLFPTQKKIGKRLIKEFLDRESKELEFGEIKRPASDREIRDNLRELYHLNISRHSVSSYRQELGIPASSRRNYGYKYPPLSANFSLFYSLEKESVNNNAPYSSGVYELRLNNTDPIRKGLSDRAEIKYPIGSTSIIYIGSGKNIRKRLKDHLRPGSKNSSMKGFLKRYKCLFRYILLSREWKEEEKKLYDLFVSTYGASPKCNKVHP